MKTHRILAILITALLFASFGRCYAMYPVVTLTKEDAKAMGVNIRAEARGDNQVWVELEFKPEGKLKTCSRVQLAVWEGKRLQVDATLKEDAHRSNPENLLFGFFIGRSLLDKAALEMFVIDGTEQIGGHLRTNETCYELKAKDHVPADLLPKEDKPSAEDLALVKSYILKGKVGQAIGTFGGFSRLHVGDTFELDLSNLPNERIEITTPPDNPHGQPSHAFSIPLYSPLEIAKVKKAKEGHISIDLSANDSHGEFLIQIVADLPTDKATSASLTIYALSPGGLIGGRSMAEAKGELKVKAPVPSDSPPKDAKEKSPIRSPEMSTNSTAKEVEAAKQQGAETAAQDIKAGVFRILYYGKPYSTGKPLVDEVTDYRVQIVAGCTVSSQFVAETDAYNQAMHDWHAKNPPTSPKR